MSIQLVRNTVDTGPVVALVNDRDGHHERCREFLKTHPGPLLLPVTVFTEVCLLLERRPGTHPELAFLADVRAGRFWPVDDLEPDLDASPSWSSATPTCRWARWTPRSSRSPNDSSCMKSPRSTTGTSPSSVPGTGPPSPCSRSRHELAVRLQYAGAPAGRVHRRGTGEVAEDDVRTPSGRRVGVAQLGKRPHPRGGATGQAVRAGRVHRVGHPLARSASRGPYGPRVMVADRPRRGSRPRPGPLAADSRVGRHGVPTS